MSATCTLARSRAYAAVPIVAAQAGALASRMLLSYLNGSIGSDVVAAITDGVQKSDTHFQIVNWVERRVQEFVDQTGSIPNDNQLFDLCSEAISSFQMAAPGPAHADSPYSTGGRAYFSQELQAVIGGISDMILSQVSSMGRTVLSLSYQGKYVIRDTYDFDNDRSMFPTYDNYRKDLTQQFADSPLRCIMRYDADLFMAPFSVGDPKKGPLIKSHIFTCFMYAIEINKCTSPLFWEAEIPFTAVANILNILPVLPTPPFVPQPVPRPLPAPKPPKRRTSPPTPQPAPAPPLPGTVYTVIRGDTLSKIAETFYGKASDWPLIFHANRDVIGSNPNLILPGQILKIP